MSTQLSLENFEEVYHFTYPSTLRYIISKCSSLDDVNDLIQDTYLEFYRILYKKKCLILENISGFIIGIAKKKIARHYGFLYQFKTFPFAPIIQDEQAEIEVPANIDLETDTITKLHAEMVWNYVKKKDIKIAKIFYLFYCVDLKINEIASELNMSESNVKNLLYRTIKEIKKNLEMDGDRNV